jgi:hypothetical protein
VDMPLCSRRLARKSFRVTTAPMLESDGRLAPEQFDQVLDDHRLPSRRMDAIAHAGRLFLRNDDRGRDLDRWRAGRETRIPPEVPSPANPNEYLEVGNASADNARITATVLLPKGAPLITIDQAGSSSDADSGPTNGAPDMNTVTPQLRPTTALQSSTEVERPVGAFELVHLLLGLDSGVSTPRHMHGGQRVLRRDRR